MTRVKNELSIPMSERLASAINEYEKAVNETIRDLTRANWLIDIAYVAVTVIFVVVAAVWSNVGGIVTTAGVSGITLISQAKASADASKVYNHDATKLRVSVQMLRQELTVCGQEATCLESVKNSLKKAFDALSEATKTS